MPALPTKADVYANGRRARDIAGDAAYGFGSFIRCNWTKILFAVLLGLMIYIMFMLMTSLAESESIGSEASYIGAAANYINSFKHHGCKGGDGCGVGCPYISSDDARLAIKNTSESINNLYKSATDSVQQFRARRAVSIAAFGQDAQQRLLTQFAEYDIVADKAVAEILNCQSVATQLNKNYSTSETVTVEVVNAKNMIVALEAAVVIYRNVLSNAIMYNESHMMIQRMTQANNTKIANFDSLMAEAKVYVINIEALVKKSIQKINENNFIASVNNAKAGMNSNDIITSMVNLLNAVQESMLGVQSVSSQFEAVATSYMTCSGKDSFSNDLPGKPSSNTVSAMISNGDYNTALIQTALEPDLVKNHRRFAKERATFDSGGGVPSVRDDDNDVVPWVGLFGRSSYRRTDGSSADTGSIALKSIPSDNPEQLMRAKVPRISLI